MVTGMLQANLYNKACYYFKNSIENYQYLKKDIVFKLRNQLKSINSEKYKQTIRLIDDNYDLNENLNPKDSQIKPFSNTHFHNTNHENRNFNNYNNNSTNNKFKNDSNKNIHRSSTQHFQMMKEENGTKNALLENCEPS